MSGVVHEKLNEIREYGWTDAIFILPESDRAEYARLANAVITVALEDSEVKDSLGFELNPGHEEGTVRTGTFGIGYPRNSPDEKVYLHTGYQSREHAAAVLPEWMQPQVMQAFWELNEAMLDEIEVSTMSMLRKLGAETLRASLFPSDHTRRNVHLRTVRYTDALDEPIGKEVVSGHADLGLMTLHLYETHGGWFYGAPYRADLITADDSPERREAIRQMRSNLRLLDQLPDSAPFFLGANWQTFPNVPDELKGLPACYHAGFRPGPRDEIVSPFAASMTDGNKDRVSVISFLHPNGDLLKQGKYTPATVSDCRPEYKVA